MKHRDKESFDTLEDILLHLGSPDRVGTEMTWVAKNYSLSQLIKDLTKLEEKRMSEEMKLFLLSLQEWVEQGHPEGGLSNGPKYHNNDSICFNAEYYADWHVEDRKLTGIDIAEQIYESLSFEMEEHLPDEGTDIPFNDGDRHYSDEMVEGKHYTNTKRLNWLKKITDKIKSGVYK